MTSIDISAYSVSLSISLINSGDRKLKRFPIFTQDLLFCVRA